MVPRKGVENWLQQLNIGLWEIVTTLRLRVPFCLD
jgi:hypothetical protein